MEKAESNISNQYKSIFSRNEGLFTELEQDRLRQSTIAVAGVGGVGGLLAERLIRLGIGKIEITDPGSFEESNLNRQYGSSMLNVGQNKAEVVFAQLKDINPQAQILCSGDGIKTENNANLFVRDCDVVVDEMDFGLFRESILLQRAARHRGIHYLSATAVGFGALVVIFDPHGLTLEEYNNFPPDIDLDDANKIRVPMAKIAPIIPSYALTIAPDAIQKMIAGAMPGPTTSIGAGLASILAANEVVNIILKRRDVAKAPQYTYIDLLDRKFIIGTVT